MQVPLLPYQKLFLQSTTKFTFLKGGIGSGKSYTLSWYIIGRMLTNPETMGLICANSYTQLHNSIMAEVFRNLDSLGLKYSFNMLTKELVLHSTGAVALCLSLEKYESLRGIQVGYIAGDEICFAREEAYSVALGRLRCPKSHALEARFTSSPNGFNFMYDAFAEGGYISRTQTPDFRRNKFHRMISASALDNFFLPEDYLPSLAMQYSPLMYEQEVFGEFVNTSKGKVYHAFQRDRNLTPFQGTIAKRASGCDFNVNPLTAVLGSVVGKESLHIYDEVWLEHSNTFELADKLADIEEGLLVIPDATGSARKTSAAQTDHQILRDAGLEVKTRRKNPSVKDRYNNTNRWLANGWLQIDPVKCPKLVADLDKLTHDNTDDELSHVSDALGYLLWYINPLKRVQPKSRIIP